MQMSVIVTGIVQWTRQTMAEWLWHIAIYYDCVGMHIAQLPYGLVKEQLAHRANLPAGLKPIVEEIYSAGHMT
jgi:hypothetical protein